MEEKRTFKERFEEGKQKAKNFWEEHKATIIKGAVATAITVGGIVLFKKASDELATEDYAKLDLNNTDSGSNLGSVNVTDFDDMELLDMVKREHDVEGFESALNVKFAEIDDLCKKHDINVDVFTTFGDGTSLNDCDIEYFVDGARIK